MLGYVKCDQGNLLVRQNGIYKALYCGLCRCVRKRFGIASSPFHSYDFVFLAAARLLVFRAPYSLEKHVCPTHPFHRRAMVCENEVLKDTAFCQVLLVREKMKDDLADRDSRYFRRLICRVMLPFLNAEIKRAGKKDDAYRELASSLSVAFAAGRKKESDRADLDEMCSDFAGVLSLLASFKAEGNEGKILAGVGDKLGRFLYTLDAMDDLERDRKKGSFNPVLSRMVSLGESEAFWDELDAVQRFYLCEMEKALALADGDQDLAAICKNIVLSGLPKEEKRVLNDRKECKA